jgi:hypothetical protein
MHSSMLQKLPAGSSTSLMMRSRTWLLATFVVVIYLSNSSNIKSL